MRPNAKEPTEFTYDQVRVSKPGPCRAEILAPRRAVLAIARDYVGGLLPSHVNLGAAVGKTRTWASDFTLTLVDWRLLELRRGSATALGLGGPESSGRNSVRMFVVRAGTDAELLALCPVKVLKQRKPPVPRGPKDLNRNRVLGVAIAAHRAGKLLPHPNDIAQAMGVAPNTVRRHVYNLIGAGVIKVRRVPQGDVTRLQVLDVRAP